MIFLIHSHQIHLNIRMRRLSFFNVSMSVIEVRVGGGGVVPDPLSS